MKNLIRLVLFSLLIVFVTNCNFQFRTKHKVSFDCGTNEIISLSPPKGTYKCQIRLIDNCFPSDSIQILSNGNIQKSLVYGTDKKGVIMDSDWYSGELGVQYISTESGKEEKKTNTIDLEVIFYNTF